MRDLVNGFSFSNALPFASSTASRDGSVIDVRGYGAASVVVTLGAVTTASATHYFSYDLYHGDLASGTDGTTVPASERIGAAYNVQATTDAGNTIAFGYLGNKRYIKVVETETGTAQILAGATAVLGAKAQQPADGADLN